MGRHQAAGLSRKKRVQLSKRTFFQRVRERCLGAGWDKSSSMSLMNQRAAAVLGRVPPDGRAAAARGAVGADLAGEKRQRSAGLFQPPVVQNPAKMRVPVLRVRPNRALDAALWRPPAALAAKHRPLQGAIRRKIRGAWVSNPHQPQQAVSHRKRFHRAARRFMAGRRFRACILCRPRGRRLTSVRRRHANPSMPE